MIDRIEDFPEPLLPMSRTFFFFFRVSILQYSGDEVADRTRDCCLTTVKQFSEQIILFRHSRHCLDCGCAKLDSKLAVVQHRPVNKRPRRWPIDIAPTCSLACVSFGTTTEFSALHLNSLLIAGFQEVVNIDMIRRSIPVSIFVACIKMKINLP